MTDIELVIKISEEDYKTLININDSRLPSIIAREHLFNSIANGTPLPKGHGRLIDADVFEKRLMDARSYYIGEKADDFDLRFAAGLKSAAERLVDAPTIIEADKGENK